MPRLPGPPKPPKPPNPATPIKLFQQFISNTKEAVERAKQGMKDLSEEIKKPFDRY